jgi:DNA mismatch endonuclease, patch repair protein
VPGKCLMTARPSTQRAAGTSWASTDGVRRSMQSNRPKNTGPELAVRSALHRAGLRFRVHYRPLHGLKREVDIAFTRPRVAVFVDGCFWHGCPLHATRPATNVEWWATKLDGNIARDRNTDEVLTKAGWRVLRFWEHVATAEVVVAVAAQVAPRRAESPQSDE